MLQRKGKEGIVTSNGYAHLLSLYHLWYNENHCQMNNHSFTSHSFVASVGFLEISLSSDMMRWIIGLKNTFFSGTKYGMRSNQWIISVDL